MRIRSTSFRFLRSFITFSSFIKSSSSSSLTPVFTSSLSIFPDIPNRFSTLEFGKISECEGRSRIKMVGLPPFGFDSYVVDEILSL